MKQLNEARRYLDSGLAIARDLQYKEIIKSAYSGLQTLDSMAGDYPAALKDYKLFIQYRDSLVNEANTKRSVQLQMQYEFDKKQAADSIQNAERLAQEELHHSQEISQQRMYTYGGAAGFLLMLVVAGISFNAYRQKQKANAIITEQKSLVEEKQKEILDSIYYARRIQRSLLPSERYIQRVLEKTRRY
jgi:hypothetical protein